MSLMTGPQYKELADKDPVVHAIAYSDKLTVEQRRDAIDRLYPGGFPAEPTAPDNSSHFPAEWQNLTDEQELALSPEQLEVYMEMLDQQHRQLSQAVIERLNVNSPQFAIVKRHMGNAV